MLENIDLTKTLDKESYKKRMSDLSDRLYRVHQLSWERGIPVAIVFEGWDASGKGSTIHKLIDPIDPRGYKIYPLRAMRTYEKRRPWLWRFWLKIPARGEWAIFDRSWYGRVLVERVEKLVSKNECERAYRDIIDFERNLADDGTLILKFFLHISKKEQAKRFKKLRKDPLNTWRVTKEDWRNHEHYKDWLKVYEEMLEKTDSEFAPWTILEATDKRHTRIKVYETIINALEERLGVNAESQPNGAQAAPVEQAAPVDRAADGSMSERNNGQVDKHSDQDNPAETPDDAPAQAPANDPTQEAALPKDANPNEEV